MQTEREFDGKSRFERAFNRIALAFLAVVSFYVLFAVVFGW